MSLNFIRSAWISFASGNESLTSQHKLITWSKADLLPIEIPGTYPNEILIDK